MSNEVAPMQAIQDKIKSRIQNDFVDLIPDEMWDRMVEKAIEDFTKASVDRSGNTTKPVFQQMIETALREQAVEAIKVALSRVDSGWGSYGDRVVGEAMQKLIDEHFDLILKSVQAGMVQQAVFQATAHMRNALQNNMRF